MAEELINTSLFLDANLKAYYRFEAADFLKDRSPVGNDLTNYNSVSQLAAGKYGVSADFGSSNTNKYFQAPTGIVSSFTGDFTIMFWFYWIDNGNWSRFFDFGTGTSTYAMLTPKNSNNSKIRYSIKIGGGAEQVFDSASSCPAGTWTHLVLTRYSGTHYLYINGAASSSTSAISSVLSSMGSTNQNYIGKSQYADPYYCGYQDDFAILNRGLSSTEVTNFWSYQVTYSGPLKFPRRDRFPGAI